MKGLSRGFILVSMVGLLGCAGLLGCTKEKQFEFIPNKEVVSKEAFSKEDFGNLKAEDIAKLSPEEKRQYKTPRIAVMSYGQATRTSSASMPYFQGRTKLVEFEIGKEILEVRELEKDPRFTDNPTNSRAIMRLPIRHVAYACEKDAYGECQNKEIEDAKVPWADRPYMLVDFEKVEFLDADELPVEMTNLVSGCFTQTSQRLIALEFDKGVFNLELQKSFRIDLSKPACWGEISDFENLFESLNFDVRYVYSIVKSDLLASKDYKAVQYKREDENAFGFFNSKLSKLDVDNNDVENSDEVFLNRWNPARKVIPYYLSSEFDKPQNDYILAATIKAVDNINNGLAQANAGIQIQLLPPKAGNKVGDLRHNMIVMVEDPLAARIIGYGPSVAHPFTGEILNARTVMYLGTIKAIVKKTYEDMREEIIAEKREKAKRESAGSKDEAVIQDIRHSINVFTNGKSFVSSLKNLEAKNILQGSLAKIKLSDTSVMMKSNSQMKTQSVRSAAASDPRLERIKRDVLGFKRLDSKNLFGKESKYIDKRIDVLSKHNIYPEELFNAEFALKSAGIDKIIASELKPWDKLSNAEKEELIQIVLPHIWIPTLVHELGHNLGLRHNFAGSEDKANFYTQDELARMGIDHAIPYSSMMEYSYKATNELPTLGKYDIAALRFAYNREVESEGGEFVKVENSLEESVAAGLKLKKYEYCTDEHASANPGCNRFDEGTNLTEIATHLITAYEDNYKRLNKRNSRRNFSLFQEGAYLGRIKGNFYDLRLMYELYERVKNDFGVEDGSPLWEKEEFLKDIYQASTMAGQFFLSNLLTPDLQCAISLQEDQSVPVALLDIRNLDDSATSCYHPSVQRTLDLLGEQNGGLKLVVAGEGGKSFRTRKDSLNPNPYQDQIDVQGVWIDKLLSVEFLFARQLGSGLFDKHTQSFLNHGGVAPHLENVLAAILLGRGAVPVPFRDADGFAVKFIGEKGEETSSLPVSLAFDMDHYIDVPEVGGLNNYFGLPGEQTTFQRQLLTQIETLVPTKIASGEARRFLDSFSVYKEYIGKDSGAIVAEVGNDVYYALPTNKVAVAAIQSLGFSKVLQNLGVDEVEKLIEMKKKGEKLPENAPDRIKAAYELKQDVLEAYVNGLIRSPNHYEQLLDSLIVAHR